MKTPTIKTGSVAELAQTIWIHTPSMAKEVREGQTASEMTSWFNAISDAQQALTFALAQPRSAARLADLKAAVANLCAIRNEVRSARWSREDAAKTAANIEECEAAGREYLIAASNAVSVRDLFHMPGSWVTEDCMAKVTARYEASVAAMAALPDRKRPVGQ
jgi:hypothetical protein